MSLLSNIKSAAESIVGGIVDVEALRTMRTAGNDSLQPDRTGVVAKPLVCPKCGGAIQVPEGQRQCYCTFCGTALQIDDGSQTLLYCKVDETRIREAELRNSLERERMALEEARRPGRTKAMIVLALVGAAMMIAGVFVGHASGDENSPWYMVEILGMFSLMAVAYIWLFSKHRNN